MKKPRTKPSSRRVKTLAVKSGSGRAKDIRGGSSGTNSSYPVHINPIVTSAGDGTGFKPKGGPGPGGGGG